MTGCAVVIPMLNASPWIEATLARGGSQTARPAEVIVVDDGSTDDSLERVARFAPVRVIRNPGKGVSAARNAGLAATRSAFIAFLDADDVWHAGHLEAVASLLRRYGEAPAALARCNPFVDGAEPDLESPGTTVEACDPWALYPFRNAIFTPSQVVARREAIEGLGGWAEAYDGVEDYYLWLRLTAGSGSLPRLTSRTVGKRIHRGSYYHSLVTQRARELLALRCEALLDAGRHRRTLLAKARRPDLDWRMEVLRWSSALADAGAIASAGAVHDAARRLEDLIGPDRRDVWEAVFGQLIGGLCSRGVGRVDAARCRQLLGLLRAEWPSVDSVARAVLQGLLDRHSAA